MALLLVSWQIYIICTTNYFYLIKIHKKRLHISIVLSYRFLRTIGSHQARIISMHAPAARDQHHEQSQRDQYDYLCPAHY